MDTILDTAFKSLYGPAQISASLDISVYWIILYMFQFDENSSGSQVWLHIEESLGRNVNKIATEL